MQESNESPLHARLVGIMVADYEKREYTIIGAADGKHTAPDKIGRHAPDILAKEKDGTFHICEAKTGDGDLTTEHSAEQFKDFSSRKAIFDIIVPKDKVDELKRVLRELGVKDEQRGIGANVKIWWPS